MDIPDSCQAWRDQMENDSQSARVLSNIEAEQCVPSYVEREFFTRLAGQGNPSTSDDAWNFAKAVVWRNSDLFQCCGNPVPESNFKNLLRLRPLCTLGELLPQEEWGRLKDAIGIEVNRIDEDYDSIDNMPEEQRRELLKVVTRHCRYCHLGVKKWSDGAPDTIFLVWSTDYDDTEVRKSLDDTRELLERLGLACQDEWMWYVVYKRTNELDLRVPRVFDAIDKPQFRPVEDCGAVSGTTRPLSAEMEEGLPEAIHKGCKVCIVQLDLRRG